MPLNYLDFYYSEDADGNGSADFAIDLFVTDSDPITAMDFVL